MSLNRRDFLKSAALAVAAFQALKLPGMGGIPVEKLAAAAQEGGCPESLWTLDSLCDTQEVFDLWGNPQCLVKWNARLELSRRRYFRCDRRANGQVVICPPGVTEFEKSICSQGKFVTLESIIAGTDFPKAMEIGALKDCGTYWLACPSQDRLVEGRLELLETWQLHESLSLGRSDQLVTF